MARGHIIGRLARDPDVRRTSDGRRYCVLRVLVRALRVTKRGRMEERTDAWLVMVRASHLIDMVHRWMSRGDRVYVEGRLSLWRSGGSDRVCIDLPQAYDCGHIAALGRGSTPVEVAVRRRRKEARRRRRECREAASAAMSSGAWTDDDRRALMDGVLPDAMLPWRR